MQDDTIQLIKRYYDAFNANDMDTFFNLMDDHILHAINQGPEEKGKQAFQTFMARMNHCYQERITDLVICTNQEGGRAAAEFNVEGTYIATDKGFPEANHQRYRLPAGAFFEIKKGKITRVTNYYNVNEWIKLISV